MKTNLPKVYLDFIEECRSKDYSELFTHKHHITPKFMGGTNESDNLIVLSVEDHFLAHKILAENCEDEYKFGNMMASAYLLNRYADLSISKTEVGLLISSARKEYLKNKSVWNKGKKGLQKHTIETKKKISEKLKGRIITDEHKNKISKSQKGITLEMRYGKEKADVIKSKNPMKNPEIVERVISQQRGKARPNTSETIKKWWADRKSKKV